MSDFSTGERLSIKDSGKSLKRYGSTCNHVKKPEFFVNHIVQKTDTLQGLALKYNTTTEQIRRVNRLFACDSLFLRDSLKIPVSKEVAELNATRSSSLGSSSGSSDASAPSSTSTESYSDDEHKSVSDFLGKIDSSIATTRAQVKHVQQHSHYVDPTDPTMAKRKSSRRAAPASLETTAAGAAAAEVPQPVVLSHGRRVRTSLQRLQQEQDTLFEL